MAITPSSVDFTYKKTTTVPPGQLLEHTHNFTESPTLVTEGLPSYLEFYDITTTNLKVKVKASEADNLSVGLHSEVVSIKLLDATFETPKEIFVGTFTINLTIEDTIVLSLSPITANFSFQLGGTTPINKSISIISENNWTISKTQAWTTLSKTTGSNSDTFEIGVVTTGLTAGNYTDTVTVDDGVTIKTIAVSFVVTDANTGSDYLYVNPNLIKFGFTIGGSIPPVKNIEINVSESWTASLSVSWLELSSSSGSSGVQTITLGLKSGAALTALIKGDHTATVTITAGSLNKTVAVNLSVYEFTTEIPSNANLLFTEDNNIVKIASSRLDTYVRMALSTLYKNVNYSFDMKLPIHNGGASKRVGVVPKKIIGSQPLIGIADFSIFQPYNPIIVNLNLHETEYFTEVIAASTAVSNLKFITGKKPSERWLSDVAKTVYVTNSAILCFSVASYGAVVDEIFITGDVSIDIDVDSIITAEKEFYTVVLPISYLGVFDPGTEFKISLFGEELNIVIKEDGIDHSMVFWENQHNCFDSCEFSGEVTITPNYKRTVASFIKDEQTSISKIIDKSNPIEYKINTGFINTIEEIQMINKMLDSDNIYLKTNNQIVQVIPKTSKIPIYKSTRELSDFTLTFISTEE